MARKYLKEESQAIKDAEKAYLSALEKLQTECEHRTILEHNGQKYEMFRVCEDCGTTCRAARGSPVYAIGNLEIFSGRAYKVSWPEIAKATPRVGPGWCQSNHEPAKFRQGGPEHLAKTAVIR